MLLLPPSAGVRAVGVDRRAAAPPGECAPGAGRAAHHRGGRLLHRVRQQHGHDHHLSARPGGAGEGPDGVLGREGNIPPQHRLTSLVPDPGSSTGATVVIILVQNA